MRKPRTPGRSQQSLHVEECPEPAEALSVYTVLTVLFFRKGRSLTKVR
jgi:hypothetical protein